MASHGLVGSDVFGVHALRFFDEVLFDLRDRTNAHVFKLLLTANGPEEVNGGRPTLTNQVASLVKVAFQLARGFRFGVLGRQCYAHGRGHADGRRSAHHHAPDGIMLPRRSAGNVGFFPR